MNENLRRIEKRTSLAEVKIGVLWPKRIPERDSALQSLQMIADTEVLLNGLKGQELDKIECIAFDQEKIELQRAGIIE